MDLLIDTKTILVVLIIGHLFTLALIISYWRGNSRDVIFNTFFLAKCIQATSWLLVGLRGIVPDLVAIALANTLQFVGATLEAIAILKLVNNTKWNFRKLFIGSTVIFFVSFLFIFTFYNHEYLRIFCASIATAVLAFLPAYSLVHEKRSTLLMKLMGYLYYLVGIALVLRGTVAIISEQQVGSLFTPGLSQTATLLSIYLVMILGNIGFILVLKERADAELMHMAYYDDLTQALNRRIFVSKAKETIELCVKENKPISFVLFDIDYFKHFNDSFGHEVGDRILQDLSKRVYESIDANSLFGRYGGDEFVIFMTGMDEEETLKKVEEIKLHIQQAEITGLTESYSISIGVVTLIPDKLTTLERLYVSSDKALYKAKHNGRNCISFGELQEGVAH